MKFSATHRCSAWTLSCTSLQEESELTHKEFIKKTVSEQQLSHGIQFNKFYHAPLEITAGIRPRVQRNASEDIFDICLSQFNSRWLIKPLKCLVFVAWLVHWNILQRRACVSFHAFTSVLNFWLGVSQLGFCDKQPTLIPEKRCAEHH